MEFDQPVSTILRNHRVVFWDFDGVIKDSVDVKTDAYVELFSDGGRDVSERIRHHHRANGGRSRFEKIPLYLSWVGAPTTDEVVDAYCQRFSNMVFHAVIDSDWVPGAHEYLVKHYKAQYFVLISATPQHEMEEILRALGIFDCFAECYGAPTSKARAIRTVLSRLSCSTADAVCLGDAETDFVAAQENNVNFLLRATSHNQALQRAHNGVVFTDFLDHEQT
jgi:phosphoglycolate phosphatase-like HAD superfamily hydrolase